MLNSENYKELLDLHLKGKLSPEESAELEKQIASNPTLKNEAALQAAIVSGIEAGRKAELKARLNSIEVGATSTQWWRYAASVGIIATVSFWYYVSRQPAATLPSPTVAIVASRESQPEVISQKQNAPDAPIENTVIASSEAHKQETQKSSTKEVKATQKTAIEASREKEFTPALPDVPASEMNAHEHPNKELETPKHDLTRTPHLGATVAGVEVVKSKKHNFHYQYFDNKLFLYGNFDSNTYEILELNTSKGQKLYLRFEGNYYGLESDKTEISKLEQVKNKETIKELDEIQKK